MSQIQNEMEKIHRRLVLNIQNAKNSMIYQGHGQGNEVWLHNLRKRQCLLKNPRRPGMEGDREAKGGTLLWTISFSWRS